MPLHHGKSKKDFAENVKTEERRGKKPSQAEAIAYAEQRIAGRHDMAKEQHKEGCHKDLSPLKSLGRKR